MIRDTYMTTGEFAKLMKISNIHFFIMMISDFFARRYLERMDTAIILFTRWRLWIRFFY